MQTGPLTNKKQRGLDLYNAIMFHADRLPWSGYRSRDRNKRQVISNRTQPLCCMSGCLQKRMSPDCKISELEDTKLSELFQAESIYIIHYIYKLQGQS